MKETKIATEIATKMIEVSILSLKARKERCEDFTLNQKMQLEAELLDAQIVALEKEYKNIINLEIERIKMSCY